MSDNTPERFHIELDGEDHRPAVQHQSLVVDSQDLTLSFFAEALGHEPDATVFKTDNGEVVDNNDGTLNEGVTRAAQALGQRAVLPDDKVIDDRLAKPSIVEPPIGIQPRRDSDQDVIDALIDSATQRMPTELSTHDAGKPDIDTEEDGSTTTPGLLMRTSVPGVRVERTSDKSPFEEDAMDELVEDVVNRFESGETEVAPDQDDDEHDETLGSAPIRLGRKHLMLDTTWQEWANCLGVDPDLFFPERGASMREAKEICRGCVVRPDCLEFALANGEKFGIWGGMSERDRRRIRRRRALEREGLAPIIPPDNQSPIN